MTMSDPEHRASLIGEETAAGLAAQEPGGHHSPEQGWGGGARVERDRIKRLAETQLRIEADGTNRLARPHLEPAPPFVGCVRAGGAAAPRLNSTDGIVIEGYEQRD